MTDGQAPSKRSKRRPGTPSTQRAAQVAGVRTPKPHPYRFAEDAPLVLDEATASSHGWKPSDRSPSAVVARAIPADDPGSPFGLVVRRDAPSTLTAFVATLNAPAEHEIVNVAPLRDPVTRDLAFIAPAIVTSPPNMGISAPGELPDPGIAIDAARRSRPGWDGRKLPPVDAKPQFQSRTPSRAGLPDPTDND